MTLSFRALLTKPLRAIAVCCALIAMFATVTPRPAQADGAASTRNIVLGAAATIAGIIIYNNIHRKQLAHDTIVGRTSDGGTVYADGRVVYPNGSVLYTSNGNGRVCSYAYGYGEPCGYRPIAYHPRTRERWEGDEYRARSKHHHQSGEQGRGDKHHDAERDRGHHGDDRGD